MTESHNIRRTIPSHSFNVDKDIVNHREFRNGDWLYTTTQDWGDYVLKLYHPQRHEIGRDYVMSYYELKFHRGSTRKWNHDAFTKDFDKEAKMLMNIFRQGGSPEDYVALTLL